MKPNEQSPTPSTRTTEMTYAILPDRMPPIPLEKMTDAQREAVADIMAGPRGEVRGPYWPILRSPGFMMSVQKVGEYTRYHCPLDRRINEMATLMAAREWTQQYIWNTHYPGHRGLLHDVGDDHERGSNSAYGRQAVAAHAYAGPASLCHVWHGLGRQLRAFGISAEGIRRPPKSLNSSPTTPESRFRDEFTDVSSP